MNEIKDTDSKKSEDYEDDFEKDLEWLINENEKSDASIIEMACEKEENINQDLKENETVIEHSKQHSDPDESLQDEVSPRRNDIISVPDLPTPLSVAPRKKILQQRFMLSLTHQQESHWFISLSHHSTARLVKALLPTQIKVKEMGNIITGHSLHISHQ